MHGFNYGVMFALYGLCNYENNHMKLCFFTLSHAEIILSGGAEGTSSSESGESDNELDQSIGKCWLIC